MAMTQEERRAELDRRIKKSDEQKKRRELAAYDRAEKRRVELQLRRAAAEQNFAKMLERYAVDNMPAGWASIDGVNALPPRPRCTDKVYVRWPEKRHVSEVASFDGDYEEALVEFLDAARSGEVEAESRDLDDHHEQDKVTPVVPEEFEPIAVNFDSPQFSVVRVGMGLAKSSRVEKPGVELRAAESRSRSRTLEARLPRRACESTRVERARLERQSFYEAVAI